MKRGQRRKAWSAVIAAGLLLSASAAHAESASRIPEECGASQDFQEDLRRRLGHSIPAADVRVTIVPELSGYRLTVEVHGERRELHDQSCQELLRAALVIALAALEPLRPALPPAPLSPPGLDETALTPAWPRLSGSVATGLHIGVSPQPSLLVELGAQLRWPRLGLGAGARYLFPTDVRDQANHGAHVGSSAAYVVGTFLPWPRVQARLGAIGYRLSGLGLGSVESSEDTAWELAPLLGASFTVLETTSFSSSIAGEGQLNLFRPQFEIQHYGEVFRVSRFGASLIARAGLVW